MKLKGEIDSIGLAELFKTLADQNANGILSVFSTMGEKHIAIQQGTLSIISDRLAERTRLGDLLIARGFLTEAQLSDALKTQRQSEQRTRLGDLLIKNNILSEDKVLDAMRFQLEEEIYDIFTWKNASFEFDSDKGVDDVAQHAIGHEDLHHLSIDAQALISEASLRMPEWQEIQQRLPTPYLCFKMSPKGNELASRATRSVQTILNLLKEGRTLETTVKHSCQSRFNVCKTVVKLLDDGWISPYPTAELQALANEHRIHKRFADALNIYRRLLESTDLETERQRLQQSIDDTIESILHAREAGSGFDSNEIVSHKKAAEQYIRRKQIRRIATMAFFAVSACVIVALLMIQSAPKPEIPKNYIIALKSATVASESGKYEEAIEIWDKFYESLPDKDTDTARRVFDRRKLLLKQFDSYVENLMHPYELLEKSGKPDKALDKLNEAQAGYTQLIEQYPNSPLVDRMRAGQIRVKEKKDVLIEKEAQAALAKKLKDAEGLFSQKQYTQAQSKFQEVGKDSRLSDEQRKRIDESLKELAQIEARINQSLEGGLAELKQKHGEKAITLLAQALKEWPDAPATIKAQEECNRLKIRLNEVQQIIKQADAADAQHNLLATLDALKKIESGYPEFELTASLKPRTALLAGQVAALDAQLKDFQTLLANGNAAGARKVIAELLRRQPGFLSARKVEAPVSIHSRPTATLKIDGNVIGLTPQEIMLPVARVMLISFELPGYQTYQRRIGPLQASDLEIDALLRPDPIRVLELNLGIFAPPTVIGETLYIFNGNALSAFSLSGDKKLWDVEKLFNETAPSRPSSSGSGPDEGVPDKNWWFPRSTPQGIDVSGGTASIGPASTETEIKGLLLALRSRDIVELKDINSPKPQVLKLIPTPVEPVGSVLLERNSKLAGKSLLAAGCADGKIRCYDLAKPEAPLWEQPADPDNPAPKGTLVGGLVSRPSSQFVSLSASGRLACSNLFDGKTQWVLDLKAPVSENTQLPSSAQENVAAILMLNGAVIAVDLNQHERLWELPVQRAMGEALCVAVGSKGIYLTTGEGLVKKFSRESIHGLPTPLWQHPLDGAPQSNLVLGTKALYVATTEGTVYAIHLDDGHELWNIKPQHKVKTLGVYKDFLYLASEDGHVIIMKGN